MSALMDLRATREACSDLRRIFSLMLRERDINEERRQSLSEFVKKLDILRDKNLKNANSATSAAALKTAAKTYAEADAILYRNICIFAWSRHWIDKGQDLWAQIGEVLEPAKTAKAA